MDLCNVLNQTNHRKDYHYKSRYLLSEPKASQQHLTLHAPAHQPQLPTCHLGHIRWAWAMSVSWTKWKANAAAIRAVLETICTAALRPHRVRVGLAAGPRRGARGPAAGAASTLKKISKAYQPVQCAVATCVVVRPIGLDMVEVGGSTKCDPGSICHRAPMARSP